MSDYTREFTDDDVKQIWVDTVLMQREVAEHQINLFANVMPRLVRLLESLEKKMSEEVSR